MIGKTAIPTTGSVPTLPNTVSITVGVHARIPGTGLIQILFGMLAAPVGNPLYSMWYTWMVREVWLGCFGQSRWLYIVMSGYKCHTDSSDAKKVLLEITK